MGYQSTTIEAIVTKLNTKYFLPAIQREFVWKPEQIVTLMDSIMRGYPISSLLFWNLQRDRYDDWDIYRFIQNLDSQNAHNELQDNKDWITDLHLVLDGQQRLTSLFIALCGSYTIKKKYASKNRPKSWIKQQLYLDLFKDGSTTTENDNIETDITYGFNFWGENEVPSHQEQYWFKVSKILNFESEDQFHDYIEDELEKLENLSREQKKSFRINLQRLYDAIRKDDMIAYHTEFQQDPDRVLDIFARTNMGGTKLSKSDLLLSMVTAQWKEINAREEIYEFVDKINNHLTRSNDFEKDFVLKSCLVLTDLPVQYRVENFKNKNLSMFRDHWENIKRAIENTVMLINAFGIDKETLTSANALIPVIYYLYKNPNTDLRGSTAFDHRNMMKIQYWLISALINGVFSGQSDTMLTNTRKILQSVGPIGDFPAEPLNDEIRRMKRVADLNTEAFLAIEYGDTEDFLALSLLYDEKSWGTMSFHKDHIFPQDAFKPQNLKNAGFNDEKIARYQQLYKRIGNLQLLLDRENISKSNGQIQHWIVNRDSDFKRRHLIPDDSGLLQIENFEEFMAAREQLIRQRLNTLFVTQTAM